MNNFQEWCKELVPVIQAAANGEDIECYDLVWKPHLDNGFHSAYSYRVKPELITVGNYTFPAPCKVQPRMHSNYYVPTISNTATLVICRKWHGDTTDVAILDRGQLHLTADAAEAHARALIQLTGKEQ